MRSMLAKILAVVIGGCLVYLAWRWSGASWESGSGGAADTMCIASKIGLPCAS
jgi:hypothetical protein